MTIILDRQIYFAVASHRKTIQLYRWKTNPTLRKGLKIFPENWNGVGCSVERYFACLSAEIAQMSTQLYRGSVILGRYFRVEKQWQFLL